LAVQGTPKEEKKKSNKVRLGWYFSESCWMQYKTQWVLGNDLERLFYYRNG
jgi:hypothetical protein